MTSLISRRDVKTENGEEIKKFLDAYVAVRRKPLEPYSVETTQKIDGRLLAKEFEQPILSEWMPDRVDYPHTSWME